MKFKVSHIDLSALVCIQTDICILCLRITLLCLRITHNSSHMTITLFICVIYGSLFKFEGVITTDNSSMFFKSFIFRC